MHSFYILWNMYYKIIACVDAKFIDRDVTFNENGVSFILMGTSTVCFDMLIIDDEENERTENFTFYLYFHNGPFSQIIDILRIELSDNEEGQFSHQSKLDEVSNMTPMNGTCVYDY